MEIESLEIEYKFQIPSEGEFAEIGALSEIAGFVLVEVGNKQVRDLYYDTPGLHLARAGLALRMRQGAKGNLLGLKEAGKAANGLHVRGEIEESGSAASHISALPNGRIRELLLRLVGDRTLQAMVTLTQDRTLLHLLIHNKPFAELSVDRVTFGNDGNPSYLGLELESKMEGKGRSLALVARQLQRRFFLTEESQTKLELALDNRRLERLLLQEKSCTVNDSAHRFARRLMAEQLFKLIKAEHEWVAHGDAESLHQFRVAVRRMRVLLSQFKPVFRRKCVNRFASSLRALTRMSSNTRNIDVFVKNWEAWKSHSSLYKSMKNPLNPKKLRSTSLSVFLQSQEHAEFHRTMRIFVLSEEWGVRTRARSRSVEQVAPLIVRNCWARLCKLGERVEKDLPAYQLHALRIALKKLRYCLEFFQEELKIDSTWITECQKVQDHLGEFHDVVTGEYYTEKLAQKSDAQQRAALRLFNKTLKRREEALRAKIPDLWRDYLLKAKSWTQILSK